MSSRIKRLLKRMTGVSTPIGGISWEPELPVSPYETNDEYLVLGCVANHDRVDESFQVSVGLPRHSTVGDLVERAKFQLAISRSMARTGVPPAKIDLKAIPDPDVFDWGLAPLKRHFQLTEIAHGRVVIAIFEPSMPPPKAAFIVKDSVRNNLEVLAYLEPRKG